VLSESPTRLSCSDTVEENEVEVQGFEGACEWNENVRYVDNAGQRVDISQLIPLVELSTSCRQLVRWRCLGAIMNSPSTSAGGAKRLTFLHNRGGIPMTYFGGVTSIPDDT